ncbi:MAG: hypothetical protein ABH854_04140 [Candidatus Diapherotrites archaeon]|nr:hypothetical protein [Candidatus Micrarchaeota archaeon]MBU1939313.1 hypothetical protein [Candidatus Micrarchaeota archaeon]
MERKIIAIVIVIVALVLVFVLYSGQGERIPDDEYVTLPSGDEILKAEYETFEDEYAGMPYEALELQECESAGELDRDLCITLAAKGQGNAGFCMGIENYDARSACYWGVAQETGNAETCANAGDGAGTCYAEIAIMQGMPELCAKSGAEKDYCFYALAIGGNKGALCANISLPPNRDNCYFRVATATLDVSLCGNMGNNGSICVADIAYNTGNSALCERAKSPQECYNALEGEGEEAEGTPLE